MAIGLITSSLCTLSSAAPAKKVLVMAWATEPTTLVSAFTANRYDQMIIGNMWAGLIRHDWAMNPIPDLAESWEISKDGLSVTFHLVRNAKWHDGQPFTSADVKFTFEQVLPNYHPTGKTTTIALNSVETPDAYTAIFKLKYPFPALFTFLTNMFGAIVPKHIYEGTDIPKNPYNQNPVGIGPFKFKEWVKGDHITLVKNENYYKEGKPYLDEVIYRRIADESTLVLALENGEVDYVPYRFPLREVTRFRTMEDFNVTILRGPWVFQSVMVYNLNHPILKDVRVRQALNWATDREDIIQKVTYGIEKVATGVFGNAPHMAWCYNPNTQQYTSRNLTKANELLDEAGYPKGADGIRFTIDSWVRSTDPTSVKITELIRDQLKEVGVALKIETTDFAVWMEHVYVKYTYDTCVFTGMGGGGPDPHYVYNYYYSSMHIGVAWTNLWGVNNSRVDQLLDLGKVEMNRTKRGEYYKEIQEILNREAISAWLYEASDVNVFNTKFEGLPQDIWLSAGMDNVKLREEPTPPAASTIYLVVGAAVVIIVVVAIVVYKRRKKP